MMLALKGLNRAERFVEEQQQAGSTVRWDGWDMIFFRPTDRARTSTHGVIREFNGRMVPGFDNAVSPDSAGIWHIDFRNVKRVKRS